MSGSNVIKTRHWFRKKAEPYAFMAPTMIWLLVFIIYPLIFAFVMAFKQFILKRGLGFFDMPWIGFENFKTAFTDEYFLQALWITVLIILIAVTVEFIIGLLVANLLSKKHIKLDFLWVVLILSPMMLPLIASGNLWRMLFDVRWGAINAAVMAFGGDPIDFLGTTKWALFSVIVVEIWQWTPFVIITLMAGFRSIPDEPREAALVDGASRWQTFIHVVFPMMSGQVLIVLLIRSMDVIKTFDIVYALTFGGPGQSTTVATFYIYRQAFTQFKLGYGSALSWIIFLLVYGVSFIIITVVRPRETSVV